MMHMAVMAVVWAAIQDPVSEAIERAQNEFRMSLVELGPAAIPDLEKRVEGPHREIVKQAIDEIRRLREPIEKLLAQLSAREVAARDLATLELLKIGRPAVSYLAEARTDRARGEWILRRIPSRLRRQSALSIELEMIRLRERSQIQALRVRAMEESLSKGKTTNLELVRARRELEKSRYLAGEITLSIYLASARARMAEELELVERNLAAGMVGALDALKVRLQLLYLDRRLGKEVGVEIKKLTQEASSLLRHQVRQGLGGEHDVLDQLFQLTTDYNEDLD